MGTQRFLWLTYSVLLCAVTFISAKPVNSAISNRVSAKGLLFFMPISSHYRLPYLRRQKRDTVEEVSSPSNDTAEATLLDGRIGISDAAGLLSAGGHGNNFVGGFGDPVVGGNGYAGGGYGGGFQTGTGGDANLYGTSDAYYGAYGNVWPTYRMTWGYGIAGPTKAFTSYDR